MTDLEADVLDAEDDYTPTPMNPDVKAKWLEALKSGKYAQTQGLLRRSDAFGPDPDDSDDPDCADVVIPAGFCCLGVLCEVGVSDGVIAVRDGAYRHLTSEWWSESMPDPRILEWAGLPDRVGDRLAEMNDKGQPFSEIAAYIEENL